LSGRTIPAALPQAARAVLAPLACDLIDDEDVSDAWRTTLADHRNDATTRQEIHELVRHHQRAGDARRRAA
ncbi:MAG TPA: hypothetical protein VM491_07410, partial [Burkholderiaceae bacterium]|nr:hypothetical protein [Burkholderiaceae bacterium]